MDAFALQCRWNKLHCYLAVFLNPSGLIWLVSIPLPDSIELGERVMSHQRCASWGHHEMRCCPQCFWHIIKNNMQNSVAWHVILLPCYKLLLQSLAPSLALKSSSKAACMAPITPGLALSRWGQSGTVWIWGCRCCRKSNHFIGLLWEIPFMSCGRQYPFIVHV